MIDILTPRICPILLPAFPLYGNVTNYCDAVFNECGLYRCATFQAPYILSFFDFCRPQWPCGLRRGPTAASLLGLRIRIPTVAWMSVCFEYCAFSGRGLWEGTITRPESPTECGVSDCDCEAPIRRRP
jgi:hypothetical protein